MKTGRLKKAEIYLSRQERLDLELVAKSDEFPPKAKWAQAMLLSADGLSNKAIAKKLGVARQTVGLWRNRFLSQGIIGLQHKHSGRKYKYEIQKYIGQTKSNHTFSLCDLRPHRLRPFNLNKLQKQTISQDANAFINLPGKKNKKGQASVESNINLERIIKIGLIFMTGEAARALRLKQTHSTLHKCFRLTRELDTLDAHSVPYVFDAATYSAHIYCRDQLNVHFWPTSGKWVDYLNPDEQLRAKYGMGAFAIIQYYRQRVRSPQLLRSEPQKTRQQKESEAKRRRVEEILHLLSESGIAYSIKNNGYYISIEGPGERRVQLWPGSGYWRVCGYGKRYSGTPQEFLAWYLRGIALTVEECGI